MVKIYAPIRPAHPLDFALAPLATVASAPTMSSRSLQGWMGRRSQRDRYCYIHIHPSLHPSVAAMRCNTSMDGSTLDSFFNSPPDAGCGQPLVKLFISDRDDGGARTAFISFPTQNRPIDGVLCGLWPGQATVHGPEFRPKLHVGRTAPQRPAQRTPTPCGALNKCCARIDRPDRLQFQSRGTGSRLRLVCHSGSHISNAHTASTNVEETL